MQPVILHKHRIAYILSLAALMLVLWAALVLMFAVPLSLTSRVPWRQALSFGISFWGLWLVFLPASAWLAFRFPIEKKWLVRNAGLHILACFLVVGVNRVSLRRVEALMAHTQRPSPTATAPHSPAVSLGPPNAFGAYRSLRAALDVLVYGSLVGICQAITHFRRAEERERRAAALEASLATAKLQALRMQIHPHFLFNTLNSIAALVYVHPRGADEMLGDLGELLRHSLDTLEENEIPLARELKFISGYLNIEQKRFGDRLRLEQNIPDELMNAMVPALVLQPLVENAIRHGIEPQPGLGLIWIEARKEDRYLHLVVRDNGKGMTEPKSEISVRPGIGIANIQARLEGLYGRDQRFQIGKNDPQGCRVDVHLPFRVSPAPSHPEQWEPTP